MLFQLDLSRSLDEQGPFDAILHKLTDLIAKAQHGNQNAKKEMARLEVCTQTSSYRTSFHVY